MRELVGHDIIGLIGTDVRRIVCEAMQILVVVCKSESISFLHAVAPIQVDVGVGKEIWQVGHTLLVVDICRRRAHRCLHVVAYVHLGEIATNAQPSSVGIAH